MSILAAGWWWAGGGGLNLPVALVWPQSRPNCDEYKQERNQTGKQGKVVTTSPWKRCQSNPNMVCAPRSNGSEFLHLSLDPTGLQRPPRTIIIIINIFDTFVNSAGLTRVCHEASFMKGSATIKSSRQTPIPNKSFLQSTNNIIRIKIHGLPRAGVVYVILCCI